MLAAVLLKYAYIVHTMRRVNVMMSMYARLTSSAAWA